MQVTKRAVIARAFAILFAVAAPVAAHAAIDGIVKIADQSTPIPGGAGNFATFSQPQVSLGNILFHGRDASGKGGLYWFDPATRQLSFALTGSPTFAVYGRELSYLQSGFSGTLYTTRGGLHVAADGPISGPLSMDDRLIGFSRTFSSTSIGYGTVNADGTIAADRPLTTIRRSFVRAGHVVYSSPERVAGIDVGEYIASSAGIFRFTSLQYSNFTLPGDDPSSTTVDSIGSSFNDDGNALVLSAWSRPRSGPAGQVNQRGIYTQAAGGPLRTVANNFTVIPGSDGTATFDGFESPAIDGGNIAFMGYPSTGPRGIFAESGGVLREIVSEGDTLDGKTVQSLSFSDDRPLSGYDLVFTATFTDGSTGLYLAEVPEPAAMSFVLAASAVALTRRRSARHAAPRS